MAQQIRTNYQSKTRSQKMENVGKGKIKIEVRGAKRGGPNGLDKTNRSSSGDGDSGRRFIKHSARLSVELFRFYWGL